MSDTRLTRRTALASLAAAGIPAARSAPAASGAGAPTALDWADAGQQLNALIRMRGALDDRLVISFLEGVYYGVMQSRILPLYGLSAGLFRQYRRRADGGYDFANFELVYVTDLDTGELLTEFRNPYSGRTGKPPQTRLGPSLLTISPAREVLRPSAPPGAAGFHRFRPARVVGDDVWIIEESAVQAPPPMNFSFNEVLTYRASARDLADPSRLHVPTEVHFNPVIGWRPWQGMEGFEGPPSHVTGSCSGRVVTALADLPVRYQEWTARLHPDVFSDPLKLLAPVWTRGSTSAPAGR